MKLYNSLARKKEEFVPIVPNKVGIYSCGPTVYDWVHIGNWRTYVLSDVLVKVLKYLGYGVSYLMNITDVGHLVGDADEGEDKLEKGARREGKTAWEVADFYTKSFLEGFGKLNLIKPNLETKSGNGFTKATDYIGEQIELIKKIEKAGFTYKIDDGIYFDVFEYEKRGHKYGELSDLDEIKEGVRVEKNIQKKDGRDFALWKFSPKNEKRDMEWKSPWGVGFPGWHIECSVMSMKHLGEQFDIHVGGEDLKSTHHPNEIAQTESVTGKQFVKYWLHGAFLRIDGGKMGKSLGNAYNLLDLEKKGFSALDLRYFYLTGHYRRPLNFTWEALSAAASARKKLLSLVEGWRREGLADNANEAGSRADGEGYILSFDEAVRDDLNMPEALATVWGLAKSGLVGEVKLDLIKRFDEVLGLGLADGIEIKQEKIPDKIQKLVKEREKLRTEKKWEKADKLRVEIEARGWKVADKSGGVEIKRLR